MTTMKTLLLAGLAVLALGGSAMADGSGVASNEYWAAQYRAAAAANASRSVPSRVDTMQSGSSDIGRTNPLMHFDTNLTAGGGG